MLQTVPPDTQSLIEQLLREVPPAVVNGYETLGDEAMRARLVRMAARRELVEQINVAWKRQNGLNHG